jgi:hypothetical protein
MAATRRPVNASLCDPEQLDNSTQPCAQSPCVVFYWKARELADCLPEDAARPCGRVGCVAAWLLAERLQRPVSIRSAGRMRQALMMMVAACCGAPCACLTAAACSTCNAVALTAST